MEGVSNVSYKTYTGYPAGMKNEKTGAGERDEKARAGVKDERTGAGVSVSVSGRVRAKAKSKNRIRKRLNYNSREISSQILRAGSAVSATQVLIRAKGKLAAVKRAAANGDYDRNEVRAAVSHASRMVTCAQKKVRHMKKEELIRHKGKTNKVSFGRRERKRELLRMELRKLKRKHRNDEATDIRQADLHYIKQKIRQQQREAEERMEAMLADTMTGVIEGEQAADTDMELAGADVSAAGEAVSVEAASVDVVV